MFYRDWRNFALDVFVLLCLALVLWYCLDIDIAVRWVEGGNG